MHHPTDRIIHTTAFVTPVVEHWLEREIAQWIHPMKDRSDDPSHHKRTLLPRSYISLPRRGIGNYIFTALMYFDVTNITLLCNTFYSYSLCDKNLAGCPRNPRTIVGFCFVSICIFRRCLRQSYKL